jgi:hypothetical protein
MISVKTNRSAFVRYDRNQTRSWAGKEASAGPSLHKEQDRNTPEEKASA